MYNDEDRKWLYDRMKSAGVDTGSYDDFTQSLNNKEDRDWYYNKSKELKLDVGSPDDFASMMVDDSDNPQSSSSEQGFVISQSQLDQEEPGAVETNREVSSPAKPTKLPNPNFMGIAEQGRRGVQQTLNAVKFQQANRGFDVKPVKLGENRHVVEQTNLNPQTGKFEKSYITESGNEYSEEEKAFANLEQNNIDEYKFSQSVEGQLRNAYDELERLKDEYNKAIQDAGKYQQIDMQGNILGISDEDAYMKASQRASNIKSAIQLTERRIASMEEVRKRRGAEKYNAKEKVKDFKRGLWDLTTDPDTWLFGLPGLNTNLKLMQAFNKAKNGEELSDDEKWLLDAEAANNSAESLYGDEKGRFYRYGSITAQALPFVVEFLTTKGGFRALSKSISGAVEKGLASNIENAAARWMVKNTGVLASDMARAVAMANTTGAAKTASDIVSRHMGQIGKDSNGNYFAQNAKDLGRSIYEGEMAQVFEYFTEMLGNHMNMGKWLAKGANKINLKKLSKVITYLTKNDFLDYLGVQDYPSEVMEEEVNLVLNALFVGDNNFSTGPLKELVNNWFGADYKVDKNSDEYKESIFNPQTQGDIIGGMFYSIGLMKAPKILKDVPGFAQYGYNFAQYKRYEHNVDAADKVASFRFTPENWEPLREQIDNATNDQMGGVINGILQNKDLSPQEKQAAMDYVGNLLKMRGFNTALMTYQKNQARDGQEPDVQEKVGQEIAKSEMEGYEAREPEEMQDVQNLMTIKREALEEVAEPGLVASLDENPVEALRNLYDEYSNSEDVSNILSLATDYVNARMRYNGMVQRISDDIDSNVQVARAQIDSNVDQHTNQLRPAVLKQDERPVYIVDDTNQSDDASIIVKDAETGKVEFVSPRDIASIGEALDPEQEKLRVETEIRNQIAQQEIDKANGTLPMAQGDVYELIDQEGKPHQVQIVADNGDGTVQAVVDGKPNEAFPKQVIQDMADLKNRARAQELANAGSSDIEPMSSDGSPMPSQAEANVNVENGINGNEEESAQQVEAMPMKGDEPDFISVTPERGYQFLSEESQWSPEEVSEFVSNNQKAAQQALAKAQEKKPKMGTSFAKFNADKAVYADNVAKAQQIADYWDAVANLDAVNKQRRDEESLRQLWSTPEGREQSLANAKNEKEKQALAKQIYGSYLNDDFYFPDTIEELVSMQLPYNGLAWESYNIGTKPIRGLKEELGSNKKRGVGRQFDTNAFNSYLAKNGEGRSVDNMAEMMYMSPENLPDGENPRWEVQDIRDAILDMLMSASKSTDIKDYVLNSRIENAERAMRAEEDQIAMDMANYARSMNILPEELDLFEEYLKAEIPRLAEAYEEFYRNFVPEETETQDNNGTEQIAGSTSVDSESAEGGSNELVAGSEGEVRGTARGEEAGAVNNEPSGTDGEAEGDTSGQPVPDNDVPEGERITLQEQIAEAEAETDTNPTEAQKEAGNYKKGHVNIDGFDVTIENPKGSVRSGVDAGGKAWSQTMNNTYGYIRGTEGVDGDHIDVFLSDNPSQGDVYVIDQVNNDGSFDEHKVMYGFNSEQEARDAYLSNYEEGWQGLGNITHVSKEEFKKWVDSSHRKTKPFVEYKSVKKSAEEEENKFAEAVEQFQNETPEEFVEFNRSVPDMSDEELLGYIEAMGYDETKAAHPVVYDEYDARHSSEYNSYYDMYESAFDNDMSREQIEETLANAEKEWRGGGFADVQRTQLSAQIDAARECLDAHPVITPDNIADYKDVIFSRMRNGKVETAKIKDIKNGEVTYDLNGKEHKSSVDNYVRALNNPEEGWRKGRMFNLRFREGEEEEIEEKAKANGTWLKAPNGNKSNLTPKQWVQTRLEDFIEYFGDWQKAARIDKLRNSENAVITGNEIDLSGKDKKKAALQYGKTLQGTYTNADTGAVIQLQRGRRNGGINEVLQHNYKDIEHLQSVAAIPQIIEKSIYISSEENHDKKKNPDVAEYQHYVCGLKIGDIDYTVHAIVAVDNKGNRYYDHNLVHIEKGKLLDQINSQAVKNGFGTTPDTKSTTNSDYKFNALVSLLQTNASKIVDENGEPMVVYHGDKAKGRYVFTPNTFITGKEDYAGRYTQGTGEVGAYYLNIRKPFDIRDEESRKIFTEYRNGHEPSPTASGAMDWADYDYDDLQEYLEENYPDKYDGFILDEGGDGGYGNEVTARGLSYIPYYPEQIKSATENNGEFSPKNKDVRFREGNDKTLAGFHNISSDKLKKALKQGGLANPSMAVINTEDRAHTDYGDISLIAPSRLIDARTGKNVGTYAGDAWTPTYPSVTLFLTAKGEKHRQAIAKENADGNKELENHLLHGLADYIDDSSDRLHFLFLKQKGLNPEIATERITHSHEEYEAVKKILGEGASTLPSDFTKEQSDALLDLMMSEYEKQVREDAQKISDEAKREATVEAMLNAKRQNLTDENGKLWFAKGDTYVNSVWRDEQRRQNPKPDWYRTDNDASYRVALEGLSEEYQKWKEQLFNDEDIEEKIFTGYTPSGYRRYVPNTLENVSRLMNKEQSTNAYSNGALSATRASLLQKFSSLAQIRKNKDLLKGDEEVQERNKEMSDKLFDIISQISDMQKISDNPFSNLDYAERRLQEALTMRNPIQYLNKEYGYDIAEDSELASQIMNFIEEVKAMPVKYFETKFKRPVYLNEFAVAVVPDDLDEETLNQLRQSGLDVRTYKSGDLDDRKRVNKEAVKGRSDILFREEDEAPIFISNAKKAVEEIKQDKATPEQWLAMITKNGGLKAGEDKWLGLSDWLRSQDKKSLTKQEVLDYIRENQIQIEEEEYGELELQQLQDEFDEIFDRIVDGVESDEVVSYPAEQAWEELKERHDGGDDFDLAFSLDEHLNIEINDELAAGYFLGKNPIYSTRLDYTTEGLDNKQEIALVVPTIESWNEDDDIHFGEAGEGRAVAWIRFGDTMAPSSDYIKADEERKSFIASMKTKYGNDYLNHITPEEKEQLKNILQKKKGGNQKVLVIDEIQSKRHQEGRENGYKVTEEKAVAEMNDFLDRMRNKYHYKPNEPFIDYFNDEEMAELDRLNAQQNDASFNYSAVPDAPFDKNWHELAMKRMLRYAAENGYDKVAWTTGEQQGDRYNLAKSIEDFYYKKNEDGTYNISAVGKEKRQGYTDYPEFNFENQTESDLIKLLGKDIAQKVINGQGRKGYTHDGTNGWTTFKGKDLKLGAEGMKGFYDEILPRFMNKYGKKWGVKVEDITLPNVEEAGRHMWAVDVTPEMKESVMQGQTMFRQGGLRFGDEATFNILLTPDLDGGPLVYKTEALPDGYPSPYNAFQAVRNHYPEYLVEYDEEHDKIRMTSWESIMGGKEQKPASKKQQREKDAYAKRVQRNMRRKAEDMAEKLHITEDVLIVDNASELPDEVFEGMNKRTRDKAKRSKGWFDPQTGKIIIIVGNNRSEKDILETILHEGVAHYGLRKLFGEHFDTFLDEVYKNAVTEVKDRINRLALEKYNFDLRAATEEYLASLAEVTDFEHPQVQSWWKPIRDLFAKMLKRLGLGQYTDAISDNELRYILWRSYHNLELRGAGVFGVAEDMAKQQELKVGPFAEENREETNKPQEKREDEETPQVKGIRSTNGDSLTKDEKNKLVALHMDFKEKRGDNVMLLFHLPQGYVLIGNDAEMAQRMFRLGQNSYTEFDESMLDMVLPRLIASGNRVAIMEVDRRNMVAEDNVPVGKFDSALKELDERGISINNKDLLDKYNLKNLILDKSGDIVKISAIVTKEQGKGDGTRFMNDLLDIADRKGWILALTPDTSFGGSSVSRLKNFYKRFGFKDNKGRNTNFATRESMVRPPMSDRIYEEAVNRGDMETATAMLREKLAKAVDIIPYVSATNYSGPHIDIAKQLKESDAEAIAEAASNMVQYIPDNAVLIPIPPHEGKVTEDTDTMKLAQALAEMKGVPVMNILEGNERESRYAAKQDNRKGVTADEMGFRKTGELPEGKIPIFIDNVVGTGETAKAASQVFGGGITLSYAKSNRSKSVKGLKNAVVTYDDNGKLIPLSKRFDPNKRDVRFREGEEGIRAKYGLVGGCINQVIDSKEELDKMLSVLPEEHAKEIIKQYNTSGILGCYSTELQLAITFADKCRSEEQVEQNQWHEQTHHVFEHLDMPDKMEAADEVLELLKNEDPALYDFITDKYDEAVWSKEAVSYFVEELVGIYGGEKFLNKNGHGNEKIVNLVTEIQNTFKYGTEGRDFLGLRQRLQEDNRRQEQESRGDNPNGEDTDGRREGGYLSEVGRTEQGESSEEDNEEEAGSPEYIARTIYEAAVRDTGDQWMIPALARALGEPIANVIKKVTKKGESSTEARERFKHKFSESWFDYTRSIKALQDAIEKATSRKIASFEDVWRSLNAKSSVDSEEIQHAMRHLIVPLAEHVGQMIREQKIDGKKITEDDVEKYINAVHGIERNTHMAEKLAQEEYDKIVANGGTADLNALIKNRRRDYSGLTSLFAEENKKKSINTLEDEARQYALAFESAVGKENTDKLWELIKALNNYSLRKSYVSGLISKKQYDDTLSMYEHYVPLRGWHDDYAGDVYQYISRGEPAGIMQGVLKKAYGRKSRAARILGTMAAMANTSIVQGNKNIVAQKLLNLARYHHDAGLLMVSDQYYQENADGALVPLFPNLREDMSSEEMRQELERFEENMKERAENNEVARLGRKFGKEFPLHMAKWQEQKHAVRVLVNGQEYMVYVLGNPRAAEAFNGLLNPHSDPNVIEEVLSVYMRYLAKMQTSLSPEFLISNFQRDVMTASTGAYIKFGPEYQKRFLKNIGAMMPFASLFGKDKMVGGIYTLLRKYENGTLDKNNDVEKWFDEFTQNGGMTGISYITKAEEYQAQMLDVIKRMRQGKFDKVHQYAEMLSDMVEFANKGIENATRFATYMTSRQEGKNIKDSIFDAKEASVNFNMKGSGAWGNMTARRLYLYVNPAMQALRMLGTWYEQDPAGASAFIGKSALKGAKRRFIKASATILSASVGTAMLNMIISAALGHGDGDDDDKIDSDWWALSEWDRYNYINIINPFKKGYFHWSIPQELRPLWALGQIAVDKAFGKITWKKAIESTLLQLNNISPISFIEAGTKTDDSIINSEIRAFTPDYIAPWTDAYLWNQDFLGHKITNQQEWNKNAPEWQRAGNDTPEWMISGSRHWNELWGGRKNLRSKIESPYMNPSAMYYILTQQFGGIGTMTKRTMRALEQWKNPEEEVEVRNLPFVPKFYVSTGSDYSKNRVLSDQFYMYWNEYKEADYELSKDKRDEDFGLTDPMYIAHVINERMKDGSYQLWKDFEKYNIPKIYEETKDTKLKYPVMQMTVDLILNGKEPDFKSFYKNAKTDEERYLWSSSYAKSKGVEDTYGGKAHNNWDDDTQKRWNIYKNLREWESDIVGDVDLLVAKNKAENRKGQEARAKQIDKVRETLNERKSLLIDSQLVDKQSLVMESNRKYRQAYLKELHEQKSDTIPAKKMEEIGKILDEYGKKLFTK